MLIRREWGVGWQDEKQQTLESTLNMYDKNSIFDEIAYLVRLLLSFFSSSLSLSLSLLALVLSSCVSVDSIWFYSLRQQQQSIPILAKMSDQFGQRFEIISRNSNVANI